MMLKIGMFSRLNLISMATLEHQIFWNLSNESNKSDFNEALEHNLEGKTSEKDQVLPKKSNWLCLLS